jgi:anti-sigma regulatory factor (Ser/Thr protein kinase)
LVAESPDISLSEVDVETYVIKPDYTVLPFLFSESKYFKEIRSAVAPIVSEAEASGCNGTLFTSLYETILNAHRHGNNRDPTKMVTVAYKLEKDCAEISVIDQGGIVNPAFIPFVFKQRRIQNGNGDSFINWYDYSKQKKPSKNHGTGTFYMHTYVDRIQYFKSSEGGLVVHLTKRWIIGEE